MLASALVACSASSVAPATTTAGGAVSITSAFAFDPAELTVSRGASVTWTNTGSNTHTVTSGAPENPTNKFNHAVDGGKTFTVTFDQAGTFGYFCSIHLSMRGSIVVK